MLKLLPRQATSNLSPPHDEAPADFCVALSSGAVTFSSWTAPPGLRVGELLYKCLLEYYYTPSYAEGSSFRKLTRSTERRPEQWSPTELHNPKDMPSICLSLAFPFLASGTPSTISQRRFSLSMSKSAATFSQAQSASETMVVKQAELTPKLPVITIVPDANPVRPVTRRDPAAPHQRALNPTTSTWNASFCDCCCSVAPTYCCIITCCPCTTVASVKESLGGGYERTLVYFGALAFGVLFCIGYAASTNSNEPPKHDAAPNPPPSHHGVSNSALWEAAALAFLVTFLFGVWRLRIQTRRILGIQGSPVVDCLSSFFCCFCVISQLHLELKCHYEQPPPTRTTQYYRQQGDENLASTRRIDTLAPYAVM
ncbi:unnamed protein product [Phytophthora fragariaefolia]|uniref:Unnamed protein product n=1 Tax=Phytophthora fragariaefolia TaxID=1490495 RepID=A0A9W7CJI8_9STRA|nr:unnamed protein product [Phytophthora fragariaefolia]